MGIVALTSGAQVYTPDDVNRVTDYATYMTSHYGFQEASGTVFDLETSNNATAHLNNATNTPDYQFADYGVGSNIYTMHFDYAGGVEQVDVATGFTQATADAKWTEEFLIKIHGDGATGITGGTRAYWKWNGAISMITELTYNTKTADSGTAAMLGWYVWANGTAWNQLGRISDTAYLTYGNLYHVLVHWEIVAGDVQVTITADGVQKVQTTAGLSGRTSMGQGGSNAFSIGAANDTNAGHMEISHYGLWKGVIVPWSEIVVPAGGGVPPLINSYRQRRT